LPSDFINIRRVSCRASVITLGELVAERLPSAQGLILVGHKFKNDRKKNTVATRWLMIGNKEFYIQEIDHPHPRHTISLSCGGNYEEKQQDNCLY